MSFSERCGTGVPELNSLLTKGYPRGKTILVEGLPGTGKTILALHFLTAGIMDNPKHPEPGILVCLDESPKDVIEEADAFGWDLGRLIELKQLVLIDAFSGRIGRKPQTSPSIPVGKFSIASVLSIISQAQKELKALRLVVDPVSTLLDGLEEQERRKTIQELTSLLSSLPLTTILNAEFHETGTSVGVERYAAHGVIRLTYKERNLSGDSSGFDDGFEPIEIGRRLRIVKMRKTAHSMSVVPYEITANGIKLLG